MAKVWSGGSQPADHDPDGTAERPLVCGGDQEAARVAYLGAVLA